MAPEKEFGTPNINVHKRTTKVNFSVVIAVVVFLVVGAAVVVWLSKRM
ncbi:MAG TPA: hypothetical protein VHO24_11755 [Opitutaceae bacterium]|nr:hypothetical protein [Opitutaceae bacterium]